MFIAAFIFLTISLATWFFSSRRTFFIKFFVPREELRSTIRRLPNDKEFKYGFRFIAGLQALIALVLFAAHCFF